MIHWNEEPEKVGGRYSFKFMRNIIVALGKVFTSLGTRNSNLVMPKSIVTGKTNYAIWAQGEMLRGSYFLLLVPRTIKLCRAFKSRFKVVIQINNTIYI